jgi:hypothetical protein
MLVARSLYVNLATAACSALTHYHIHACCYWLSDMQVMLDNNEVWNSLSRYGR